ncbi:MAG: hypothetical protein RCG15_02890 [Candidatus Rickettsia vulgarisii]
MLLKQQFLQYSGALASSTGGITGNVKYTAAGSLTAGGGITGNIDSLVVHYR